MSQYPLDSGSDLVEALNYLLSGPTSIGQNFEGLSAVGVKRQVITNFSPIDYKFIQTWFTGLTYNGTAWPGAGGFYPVPSYTSAKQPGTQNNWANVAAGTSEDSYYPIWNNAPPTAPLYHDGFPITAITPVTATGRDITITVTLGGSGNRLESKQPWANGQRITIAGVTPSIYNGTYNVINFSPQLAGYAPAPTVTLRRDTSVTWGAYVSGGNAKVNAGPGNTYVQYYQSFFTGLQAIVSVTGPTDRVFISSQSGSITVYTCLRFEDTPSFYEFNFELNRYIAVAKTTIPDSYDPNEVINSSSPVYYQGFEWKIDKTIVSIPKDYGNSLTTDGFARANLGDTIFNNVIDNPGIGTYLYAFQISGTYDNFDPTGAFVTLLLGASTTGVRSFTAQVIKT